MIRNYTSEIPASRSIGIISEKLVAHGARSIQQVYDDNRRLSGIIFDLTLPKGNALTFRLPARVDAAFEVLKNGRKYSIKPKAEENMRQQAERTAWKLIADWVDVQLSMISLEQAELAEIFMPYVYDRKRDQTFFEYVKEQNFRPMLMAGGIKE